MRSTFLGGVLAMAITTSGVAQVQQVSGSRAPSGGRTLVAMNFAGSQVGDFPPGIEPNTGNLEVVDKNGQHMLRATTESSFLVTLPELMPQDFLLEFELIPKSGHGGYDFTIEGTKEVDQGSQSIHLLWHSTSVRGVGGGGTGGFDAPMPEAVRVGLGGAPTTVVVSVTNQRIQFFANGTLTHTLPNRRFARSRILRVSLGGENEDDGAVYLTSFRVAAMGAAATTVAANQNAMTGGANPSGGGGNISPSGGTGPNSPGGSGSTGSSSTGGGSNAPQPNAIANLTVTDSPAGPIVNWLGVNGATYLVQRWLVADPACCAGSSPASPALTAPPWQDTPLPVNGTYVYSVTATTSTGSRNAQVQFSYTSAPASGRAMPTTTNPLGGGSTSATSAPTTTMVTVPASPGAVATPVQTAPSALPATTSGTTGTLPPPPTGSAATFPAPTSSTTSSTVPPPPGVPAGSGGTAGTSGGSTTPTGVSGGSGGSSMFPTASPTGTTNPTHSATSVSTTGRYRVTLTGIRVYQPTLEVQLSPDGKGDEVFAAAEVVVWDRTRQTVTSRSTVKTKEYGELANSTIYPNRIAAGTLTPNGGIWIGNGVEQIPAQYDPSANSIPAPPTTDRFPLQVWEGVLTDGVDAVLVVPALWDRDLDPSWYNVWSGIWRTAAMLPVFSSPAVSGLIIAPQLTAAPLSVSPGVPISLPPPELTASVKDHPIGMTAKPVGAPPLFADYQDRYVMITREKLTSLQIPGATMILPVTFTETTTLITQGSYTLYLRIERLQ